MRDEDSEEEELPECFSTHSPTHPECIKCLVKEECREEKRDIKKKEVRDRIRRRERGARSRRSPSSARTRSRTRRYADESDDVRREEAPDIGFFNALAHNGALEGVTAFFRELLYASKSIPRIEYESPWEWHDDDKDD